MLYLHLDHHSRVVHELFLVKSEIWGRFFPDSFSPTTFHYTIPPFPGTDAMGSFPPSVPRDSVSHQFRSVCICGVCACMHVCAHMCMLMYVYVMCMHAYVHVCVHVGGRGEGTKIHFHGPMCPAAKGGFILDVH
jgi:hypothetical protein